MSSHNQLTSSDRHLKLMDELELLAKNVIEITGQDENTFKIGYHSEPSMQRLHVHVISDDFHSPSLKTKIHWNSYNTPFFWNVHGLYTHRQTCGCFLMIKSVTVHVVSDVHQEIKRNGTVVKPTPEISKKFLATALRCHKCDFTPKNVPDLKQHLIVHVT